MSGRPTWWPPWWFDDPSLTDDDCEMANLLLDMRDGRTMDDLRVAVESSSDEEGSEETSSEEAGDDGADNSAPTAPAAAAATTTPASTAAPASVIPQGDHWRYKQPMAQPLGYRTAADAAGGERTRTYAHEVDFNSRASVNLANKTRAREVYRDRVRYKLPPARESMRGHEFTTTHFDWIAIAHEAYAILHNGQLIPWNILSLWWEFCWRDGRSEQALRALESRNQEFKDLRNHYRQK